MAKFVNFNICCFDNLKTIIRNGYTRKVRDLLKGQGLEFLSSSERRQAMLNSKIKVSTFEMPSLHKVHTLRQSVNNRSCDIVEVAETPDFLEKVAKLYGVDRVPSLPPQIDRKNYCINKAGQEIGYFTMLYSDGAIRVGNFAIVPEQRSSRSVMEALLSLRDEVAVLAKKTGAKKVKAEVDIKNPELLSLYKRFGFQPISKFELEGPMGMNMGGQYLIEALI